MATPRSPSPTSSTSDAATPGTPLTPNSKLKQLFANLGDSSDEEDNSSRAKLTGLSKSPLSRSPRQTGQLGADKSTSDSKDESDEEDEDNIVRPRGRLASRMKAGPQKSTHSDSELDGGVRERVRRLLQKQAQQATETSEDRAEDEGEEQITTRCPQRRSPPQEPTEDETPQREPSPGMFVTPMRAPQSTEPQANASAGADSSDDDELPANLVQSQRFKNRLVELRDKRVAREAEERRKKEESRRRDDADGRDAALNDVGDDDDLDDIGITDDEGGRRLTQEVRPARQASKKALEEMHRESQRLSRSLQLAHEARTKKKITKASLFERFNFKLPGKPPAKLASSSRPTTPVSAHNTDTEMKDHETPPSSPPPLGKEDDASGLKQTMHPVPMPLDIHTADVESKTVGAITHTGDDDDAELPDIDTVIAQAQAKTATKKVDKGKGKATAADLEEPKPATKRQFRVKIPTIRANLAAVDSDEEELVIMDTKKSKIDAIFDRIPAKREQEDRSLHALRILAQIGGSPGKERARNNRFTKQQPSMTAGELQAVLHQRAREQARLEREARLEALKAKGVHIQTEAEREKEMQVVEDIVAKARKEAEEIMRKEMEDAKQEKKEKKKSGEGVADPLAWDDSDDDEYEEVVEEEPAEIEISGSEEEDGEDGEDVDMMDESGDEEEDSASENGLAGDGLVDDQAESTDESAEEADEEQEENDENDDEDGVGLVRGKTRRTKKHVTIISDDEDDDNGSDENVDPTPKATLVEATPKPKVALFKSPATLVNATPKPNVTLFKSPSVSGNNDSPQVPTSVLRSATKTFIPGLPVKAGGPAGLGLTQIFAGTMDDGSQFNSQFAASPSQPMPTFVQNVPFQNDDDFSQSISGGAAAAGESQDVILNSQPLQQQQQQEGDDESQGVQLHFTQSQAHGFDSLMRNEFSTQQATQQSDFWLEPTQDEGFQDRTPLKQRFINSLPLPPPPPASIVETPATRSQEQDETLSRQDDESPLAPRKHRLLRRKIAVIEEEPELSDEDDGATTVSHPMQGVEAVEATEESQGDVRAGEDAFAALNRAAAAAKAKKAQEEFNRKKSKAKEMVEEQAEESEDEYAGLGGADGEDSDDDGEDVKEMIDDKTNLSKLDKAKIAAFYADRERASDEQQVEKLFRDITSGMLRRKRARGGGDFDLSDEDDGGEARRRMKRRQFAKMQKALFADERVSRVAENPRTRAFLRTIEDRGSDEEEMDFLFEHENKRSQSQDESQSQSEESHQGGLVRAASAGLPESIPNSQPESATTTTTTAAAAASGGGVSRRRTREGIKPSNMGEIRESLSNLLEEHHHQNSIGSVISATQLDSDESDVDADAEDNSSKAAGLRYSSRSPEKRRPGTGSGSNKENRHLGRRPAAIVDRISLKRAGSTSSSTSGTDTGSGGGGSRTAFAAPAGASTAGVAGIFKVPALLRRATTNSSLLSHNSIPTTTSGSSASSSTTASGTTTPNNHHNSNGGGGFGDDAKIRKGAGKKSGVNFFARENERLAALAEKERRRQARKWKGAEGRGRVVGDLFSVGKFE